MQPFREELSMLFNEIELLRDLYKFHLSKYSLKGLPLDIDNLGEYLKILRNHYHIPQCDIMYDGDEIIFSISYDHGYGVGYDSVLTYNRIPGNWKLDCNMDTINELRNHDVIIQEILTTPYIHLGYAVESKNLEDFLEYGLFKGFNRPFVAIRTLPDPYHL